MNKQWRLVIVAGFLLAACAGRTAAPAADAGGGAPATPAALAATAAPTTEVLQFVATDPAGVNLAAGKPQLVEFFAFW